MVTMVTMVTNNEEKKGSIRLGCHSIKNSANASLPYVGRNFSPWIFAVEQDFFHSNTKYQEDKSH